ncbi:MAG: hypothetical protein ACK4E5_03095 [Erythrobacter cryptus]
MLRKIFLLTAACTLLFGQNVAAQNAAGQTATLVRRSETPVSARMGMHVHSYALKELEAAVPARDVMQPLFLRLVLLAKQEATAISCEGFEKDRDLMIRAMFRTLKPVLEGAEAGKPNSQADAVMRAYHIMMGGELAIFAQDPDGFCEYSQKLVEELGKSEDEKSLLVITQAP